MKVSRMTQARKIQTQSSNSEPRENKQGRGTEASLKIRGLGATAADMRGKKGTTAETETSARLTHTIGYTSQGSMILEGGAIVTDMRRGETITTRRRGPPDLGIEENTGAPIRTI